MLSTSRHPFETSNLSQHPIKNLQTTINILTNQEDNEQADTEEVLDTSHQKKPIRHSFPDGSSKPDKRKGKNTGNQSSQNKIPPASGREEDDDSSSDKDPDQQKPWHPKSRQKINMTREDNQQEQAENRKRMVAEWMIKG